MLWVLLGGLIVIGTGVVTFYALMVAAERADRAAEMQYEILCAQQREERKRRAERVTMNTLRSEPETPLEAYLRRVEAEEEAERAEAEMVGA